MKAQFKDVSYTSKSIIRTKNEPDVYKYMYVKTNTHYHKMKAYCCLW